MIVGMSFAQYSNLEYRGVNKVTLLNSIYFVPWGIQMYRELMIREFIYMDKNS